MSFPGMKPHWIKQYAQKERARRDAIEQFKIALPNFTKELANTIESDLSIYRQEIPDDTVTIEADPEKAIIGIVRGYPHKAKAVVKLNVDDRSISCEYEAYGAQQNWREPLQTSALGIHKSGKNPELTAKELSVRILQGLLFSQV